MVCVSIQYCKDSKTFAHPAKKHTTVSEKSVERLTRFPLEHDLRVPAGDAEYRQGLQTPVGKESGTSNSAGVEEADMLWSATPAGLLGVGCLLQGCRFAHPYL